MKKIFGIAVGILFLFSLISTVKASIGFGVSPSIWLPHLSPANQKTYIPLYLWNPSTTAINYSIKMIDELKPFMYWNCNEFPEYKDDYWCVGKSYVVQPNTPQDKATLVKVLFIMKNKTLDANFTLYLSILASPIGIETPEGQVGVIPAIDIKVQLRQDSSTSTTTTSTSVSGETTSTAISGSSGSSSISTSTTTTSKQIYPEDYTSSTSSTSTTTTIETNETIEGKAIETVEENIGLILGVLGVIGLGVFGVMFVYLKKAKQLAIFLLIFLSFMLLTQLGSATNIQIDVNVIETATNLTVVYNKTMDAGLTQGIRIQYEPLNEITKINNANVSIEWNGTRYDAIENATAYYWNFNSTIHGENLIYVYANKTNYQSQSKLSRLYVLDSLFKIRFWNDLNKTLPYFNEFSWVYLRDENCNLLYPFNCSSANDVCFHGKYENGEAEIRTYYDRNWTMHYVSGIVKWDGKDLTVCPTIEKYDFWVQVDSFETKAEGTYEFDYYIRTALYGTKPTAWYYSQELWIRVGLILIFIGVAIAVGYFTESGLVTVIVMLLLYIVFRLFRLF